MMALGFVAYEIGMSADTAPRLAPEGHAGLIRLPTA
jgi:hypothetical protein